MKLLTFIVCLAAIGVIGCKKEEDPGLKALPDRRMAEIEVVSAAESAFPRQIGYSYHTSFKDGVWEVSCKTNKTQVDWLVIATVRDADGKIEPVTRP
jgi:hypothetical protein